MDLNSLMWCIFWKTVIDSPPIRLMSSICNSAWIPRMHFPAAREGTLRRRHFEWKRGAQLRSMQEERRVRSARSKRADTYITCQEAWEQTWSSDIGRDSTKLRLCSFCFFLFPLPPHYGWPSFTLQRLNRGREPFRPQRCFATEKRARSEKPQIYRAFFQAADVLQPLHRFYMVSILCVCPAVDF